MLLTAGRNKEAAMFFSFRLIQTPPEPSQYILVWELLRERVSYLGRTFSGRGVRPLSCDWSEIRGGRGCCFWIVFDEQCGKSEDFPGVLQESGSTFTCLILAGRLNNVDPRQCNPFNDPQEQESWTPTFRSRFQDLHGFQDT